MLREVLAKQSSLALLSTSALLLILAAQLYLQQQQLSALVLAILLLGLSLWAWLLRGERAMSDRLGTLAPSPARPRLLPLGLALLLAAVAFYYTGGNVFRAAGVIPWLLAVGLWFVAWWPRRRADDHAEKPGAGWTTRRRLAIIIALLAIMAIGGFFRFYRLADVPRDPTSDHAEKLLDVQDVIDGKRPIFFRRNTGREPAQFYITYSLIQAFDLPTNFNTLKLGTALIDMLAIPALFLLASELAGAGAGLLAALLYSTSKWIIAIARMGLRFPYAPLPTALALWSLLRYMRRGERSDALLCGLFIGLGLYGYSPFRIVVLVVPVLLLLVLLFDRRRRGRRMQVLGDGLLIGATSALVFLPLGHFMIEQPNMFWYRAATRAANAERQIGETATDALANRLPTFLQNNLDALLAFNWRGDSTIVNAVRYDPFLDPIVAAALLAGAAFVLYQIIIRRSLRYAGLLLVAPILMLASTLSIAFPIENPSVNRMGAVAPVIFTIAAIPLALLAKRLISLHQRLGPAIAGLALLGLLTLSANNNYVRYFHDYPPQYNKFVPNTSAVVSAIRSTAPQELDIKNIYVLSFPHWLDTRNVGIGLGQVRWGPKHTVHEDEPLPQPTGKEPLLFVINREDQARLKEVRRLWPKGTLTHVPAQHEGKDFFLFLAPAPKSTQ